ncbi:MAG: hypothetical protein KY395_07120 [Actinobacteria bacterium]|nr:hypothetical protein [Actinomycetota bacterium]
MRNVLGNLTLLTLEEKAPDDSRRHTATELLGVFIHSNIFRRGLAGEISPQERRSRAIGLARDDGHLSQTNAQCVPGSFRLGPG